MTDGYAILMACFGAALLGYAAILAWTRDPRLIPRYRSPKGKDRREQVARIARIVALAALAPLLSALVSYLTGSGLLAFAVLVPGMAALIWLGVRKAR